jgi:hypothetical protein
MTGGESVFQGREGTGLAQILNWQEFRPTQVPHAAIARQQQLEQQRQKQQRAEDYKKIDDFMKFDKGYEYFNPDHQRDMSSLQGAFARDLDTGMSAQEAMSKYRGDRDRIQLQIQKGKSAHETYKRKLTELKEKENVDMSRAVPFLNDALYPAKDTDGYVNNFDAIDENRAMTTDLHPSVYDAERAVLGSANKIKNQIEIGEVDPEQFRGNNGAFFTKTQDKWRFRTDPKTGRIADDVVQFYADSDNGKIYDRILWDEIAQKNGVLSDNVILPDERNQIDEIFMREKDNPQHAPMVKSKIETWLNQIQAVTHRTDPVSAGRDLNPNGNGWGAQNTPPKLSEAETVQLAKDYDAIPNTGGNKDVIAVEGRGVDLQNYLKNTDEKLTLSGKTGNLIGLGIDPKTGERSIVLRGDKGYNGAYPVQNVPFNDYNEKAITKYLSNMGVKAVDEWKKSPIKKLYRDESKINEFVDEVQKTVKGNADDSGAADDLKKYLLDNGINVNEVSVDHSNFPWTSDTVTIDGESFDLNKTGLEKMKKTVFNKNMLRFGTDKDTAKPAEPTITPEDFDAQWAKLKPGETIVGPDGKTYTKK